MVAPDLVGWVDEPISHCYWKKQPETPSEFEQAFKIFEGQELGCHRYAGHDPAIQMRVGYECSDHAPLTAPRTPLPLNRIESQHWGQPKIVELETQKLPTLWSRIFRRHRS